LASQARQRIASASALIPRKGKHAFTEAKRTLYQSTYGELLRADGGI
jgi:hypothetical protein